MVLEFRFTGISSDFERLPEHNYRVSVSLNSTAMQTVHCVPWHDLGFWKNNHLACGFVRNGFWFFFFTAVRQCLLLLKLLF